MAADDHESGGVGLPAQKLHRYRAARVEHFGVLVDRDEAVGAAPCGDGTRAFAHRIRGESIVRLHEADQQVFGASALGIDAHRQCRLRVMPPLERQACVRAQHRCNELVEREDRGRWKAGKDHHRLAARHRKADRLAGLQRHAVRDDARIREPADDAIGNVASAFRRATREDDDVGRERARQHPADTASPARIRDHDRHLPHPAVARQPGDAGRRGIPVEIGDEDVLGRVDPRELGEVGVGQTPDAAGVAAAHGRDRSPVSVGERPERDARDVARLHRHIVRPTGRGPPRRGGPSS